MSDVGGRPPITIPLPLLRSEATDPMCSRMCQRTGGRKPLNAEADDDDNDNGDDDNEDDRDDEEDKDDDADTEADADAEAEGEDAGTSKPSRRKYSAESSSCSC